MFSITSYSVRENEIFHAVETAAYDTIKVLNTHELYKVESQDEMIADFIQNLLIQIDSDSAIKIRVLEADFEEGLLDVEVTEIFKYPNGVEREIPYRKTVIIEEVPAIIEEY